MNPNNPNHPRWWSSSRRREEFLHNPPATPDGLEEEYQAVLGTLDLEPGQDPDPEIPEGWPDQQHVSEIAHKIPAANWDDKTPLPKDPEEL